MSGWIIRPYEKRFVLSLLILCGLAALFWTGSRYPALNEKAMMSGAIQLEDALSFEARFDVSEDMSLPQRLFWSTLNWVDTNKKGMGFGICFAAAFLTLLSYVQTKSFRGGLSNAFLGLAIGTPLGVCVNCAAPIARGMYSSGLRAETTLSAMIASPTLNAIVLTMLFSLMPFYMAVTKIVLSLVIILVAVPVICRFLPQRVLSPAEQMEAIPWSAAELGHPQSASARDSLGQAVWSVAQAFIKNLWYIIRMTVPLMLLAGFLGTVAAVLLPTDGLFGLELLVPVLVLVVLVGVFLPVPIGFDVVMAGVLLASGLAPGYVMALLFTLGSFSVYSLMIVVQAMGWRAGWMMAAAVAVMGFLAGLGVDRYHQMQSDRALDLLLSGQADHRGWGAAYAQQVAGPVITGQSAEEVSVQVTGFHPSSAGAETGFTRLEAWEVGIDKPLEFSMRDMWPPFWEGRSLASGDIDRDGDLDLAIASTEAGLYLYQNDGQGRFDRIALDLGPLADVPLFNAALVDIDNDGWLDLFLTSYLQGNFIWHNQAGRFGAVPLVPVANGDAPLTLALSFADADGDGDLDAAMGNWAAGWYRRIPGEESRNRILWNHNGALTGDQFTDLPGIPGETLSILFSDLNSDGHPDLIVGNDFDIPDYFYLGRGGGDFGMITHADGLIPHTTTTTMAVAVGDLTGNGQNEIYLAQIAGRSSGVSETLKMQPLDRYCDSIKRDVDRAICAGNMQIKEWYKSGNNFDPSYARNCQQMQGRLQAECKAMLVKDLAIQRRDPSVCALIPVSQPIPRAYCDLHFKPPRAVTAQEAEDSLQQVLRSNVLLHWNGAGFDDVAEDRGLEIGGWSWDTKLADFDNDGDLDVYVVNGTWVPNEVSPSNLFFENDGTGRFTEASGPFGLEDYLMTAAATQFDMDGDGDLDLVTHPVNGPLVVFRNNAQQQAIGFDLRDLTGNHEAVGAKIELLDDQGRVQMREVQMGGGFMSFDAPQIYFGLPEGAQAVSARIIWPDGGETQLQGGLRRGRLYHVTRG